VSAAEVDRLRGPILRSVSRSFYLSLRMLPEALRDPLSLAYLLARATDTIADTVGPPLDLRVDLFRKLAGAIQGTEPGATALNVRSLFVSLQSDESERTLIDSLPAALEWLESLSEGDRREVRTVLQKINAGQLLDLERFGSGEGIQALTTAADLDQYTYLVAGSVGEFWTRLCFAHVRGFSNRGRGEMEELGKQYGKALQLINVLRDAGADLRQGRSYLPREELRSLGIKLEEILIAPEAVEPLLAKSRDAAESGLNAGLDYSCAIESARVRCATALPALLGARTLALLRAAGSKAFNERVKVPRTEVQSLMIWAATTFASPRALRKKFADLSSG